MRRILFIGVGCVMSVLSLNSQDIKIINEATTTVNNSYVYVVDDASTYDISHNLWVQNNSGQTLDIKVLRKEIEIVNGTENATCWEICPPSVPSGDYPEFLSNTTVTIEDGDFDYSFSAHLYPEGNSGCSHYRYVFIDDNAGISDSVDIYFNHGQECGQVASLSDNDKISDINIFPNPASKELNINFNANTHSKVKIEVVNLLGAKIYENSVTTSNQNHIIPLEQFEDGLYFVTVYQNNKAVLTKKVQVVR